MPWGVPATRGPRGALRWAAPQSPAMAEPTTPVQARIDARALWRRTRRITLRWLGVWALVVLVVPWFARDLDRLLAPAWQPVIWIAMLMALPLFLLIIVAYTRRMERLEAEFLAQRRAPPP